MSAAPLQSAARRYYARLLVISGEGLGPYLLAVLCLAGVALATRMAYLAVEPAIASPNDLATLFNSEQEPLRDERRPAVAAAIVGRLAEARVADYGSALDRVQRAYESFREQFFAEPLPSNCPRVPEETASLSHLPISRHAWVDPCLLTRAAGIDALAHHLDIPLADQTTLKAFYFISRDGGLRILPKPRGDLPSHTTFLGRSYVAGVYEKLARGTYDVVHPSPYISIPYLDMLGRGIVATICYPVVRDQSYATPRHRLEANEGVFCADIGLPRDAVLESFRSGVLLRRDAFHVELPGNGCDLPRDYPVSDPLTGLNRDELVRTWCARPTSSLAAVVRMPDTNVYVASLWQGPPSATGEVEYELGVVRRQPESYPTIFWVWCAVALVCFVIGTGIIARAQARRQHQWESVMMRSLPVGMLRNDHNDLVVAGNDRAEEILRRKLPRLTLAHHRSRESAPGEVAKVNLEHLFVAGRRRSQDGALHEVKWSELREEREKGQSRQYYAQLNIDGSKRWISVAASPIFMPDGSVHTFGVFELVDHGLARELDADLEQAG